ncbi:unnamed protein product [Didymodactylos carnosus]|uniref:DNA replication licensing factor MCM2 n=1 Tax=Didymodactylos carnosus TaxID=1234261 RepID=A0A814CK28_9BILA|nr:unnamed protein product [Didymodactylos carnosus]CAF0945625.1 unnamed protein product [Didymodactylos carnosus]CAF3577919.1 unnamed protein product [Didymodactylos carnosus]CAF3721802.1 unnamed protein product [Didymodactylos carnosus]
MANSPSYTNGDADDTLQDDTINDDPEQEDENIVEEEEILGGTGGQDESGEESGEDLFNDDYELDYQAIPELDRYAAEGVDDEDVEDMTIDQRREVDALMKRREREKRRRLGIEDDFEDDESDIESGHFQGRKRRQDESQDEVGMDDDANAYIKNLGDTQGHKIQDWVVMPGPHNEIIRHFKRFLRTFRLPNSKQSLYREAIRRLVQEQRQSVIVDFEHLMTNDEVLAFFLLGAPEQTLKIFNEAITQLCFELYPNHRGIDKELFIRISNCLQNDNIRDLRVEHLNKLIGINGVVTTSTGVLPQLSIIKFNCLKCGFSLGPFTQNQENEIKPGSCPECQSNGPFEVNMEETLYRNYQRISIQESPGTVPPGRIPRSKEILLLGDLCDTCRPGDEIEVLGVYRNTYNISLNIQNNLPVFATIIEANHVSTREDKISFETLTDEDIQDIIKLSNEPRIAQRIYASMAPSIYGHEMVKKAIAFAMFGGEGKNPGGKHQVRGDINLLLCGDPSTAKSQFLKYIEKTAHRAVFTTGRGASAVGLTAYVQRNPITREWTLEAGALVLADRGVCLIDEFDKMSDQDRTSIHEAMEQQSISISKAGIVTTLQARCSVIAAANPIGGRYDPALTFMDNVDLSEPILTRFDILCIVRDVADPINDELMARFVTESHMRHHPLADENDIKQNHVLPNVFNVEPIPQDMLKKYLIYAKRRIHPRMTSVDQEKVSQLYAKLRRESLVTGSVPVTVRQIESMVRIAEAHARMHLRDFVNDDDINVAIQMVLESFIETQKYGIMRTMKKVFQGYLTYKKDNNEFLLFLLKQLVQEFIAFQRNRFGLDRLNASIKIAEEDLISRARQYGVLDLQQFYQSTLFRSHGFKYEDKSIVQIL